MPTPASPERGYSVPNLVRALRIVELLGEAGTGLTLSEITARTGFPMNAVYRISQTLVAQGYLRRDPKDKRLGLTRKLMGVSSAGLGDRSLVQEAHDELKSLRDATGETVCLATLLGDEGVVLDQLLSLHPFKFMIDVGSRFALPNTAPGKVFLAHLPAADRDRILSLPLPAISGAKKTRKTDLRAELAAIAAGGCGIDRGESAEGCHCVAAAVLDDHRRPAAAIWVTGPANRLRAADFARTGTLLQEHARRIMRKFGWA